jgi:hypothetical protein
MPSLPQGPKVPPPGAATLPEKTPLPRTPLNSLIPRTDLPPGASTLSNSTPLTEKVQSTYKQLTHAASDLNAASDELAKPIQIWEAALKKLNLGVPAWVEISSGGDDQEYSWWDRSVGYSRLKNHWGIALRSRDGNHRHPGYESEEIWAYNDAPRWMRIESVGKLPDLLDALLKQAQETARKIRAKTGQANELAEAISKALAEDK